MTRGPRSRYDLGVIPGGLGISHVDTASVPAANATSVQSNVSSPTAGTKREAPKQSQLQGQVGWDRLERAVRGLVERQDELRGECAALRTQLAARDQRIRTLETEVRESNQLRQDTAKRLDELIAELDQLDAQLAKVEKEA